MKKHNYLSICYRQTVRKQFVKLTLFLLFLSFTIPSFSQQNNDAAPNIQWDMSFLDDEPFGPLGDPTNPCPSDNKAHFETDWLLEMIEAENGSYIGVGYSTTPSSRCGKVLPTWIALTPEGRPKAQADMAFGDPSSTTGRFEGIAECSDGYVMSGGKGNDIAFCKVGKLYYNIIEEKLITLPGLTGVSSASGRGMAVSKNDEVIIVGNVSLTSGIRNGLVLKTDISGNVLDFILIDPLNAGNQDFLYDTKIINDDGLGNYDIIFTGTSRIMDNSITITSQDGYVNASGEPVSENVLVTRNNDVIFGKISSTLNNQSLVTNTFDSGSVIAAYPKQFTTEFGPFTPGSSAPWMGSGNLISDELIDNSNDAGYDIHLLPDGNVAITAMLNKMVMTPHQNNFLQFNFDPANDENIVKSQRTIPAGSYVEGVHGYHDYIDADAYLMVIDPASGNLLNGTQHVGHISGADSHCDIDVEVNGDIIVAITTADKMFEDGLPDILTNTEPSIENNFLIKLAPDATTGYEIKWRKHFVGQGEGNCAFDVKATRDGGYVVGGNNAEHLSETIPFSFQYEVEKFVVVKLASSCQNDPNWYTGANDISEEVHTISSGTTENWTTDINVKGTVRIESGATLNIGNTGGQPVIIQFAYEKYNEDYGGLFDDQNTGGIIVETGGRLIINNAILQGLNSCGVDQMWEGIHIMGNPFVPQVDNFSSVTLGQNTKIKDAVIGVYAGDVDYEEVEVESTISVNSGTGSYLSRRAEFVKQQTNGGGIILTNGAGFTNNRECVVFAPFMAPNSSSFQNTRFSCDRELLDTDFYNYFSFPMGVGGTLNFVSMFNVQSVDFQQCRFSGDYQAHPWHRGTGINAIDSRFNVIGYEPNTGGINFKSLTTGINVSGITGGLINSAYVRSNIFENVLHGINLRQSTGSVIFNNHFERIPYGVFPTYGVYAFSSGAIEINGNHYFSTSPASNTYGTIINGTGDDGGSIYNDTYADLRYGSQFEFRNPFFETRCSDYDDISKHAFVVAPSIFFNPQLGDQGSLNDKVDNTFRDNCSTFSAHRHLYSNINTFTYFEHAGNSFPVAVPPDASQCLGPVNVLDYSMVFSVPDCDGVVSPCPEPPCFTDKEEEYENSDGGVKSRNKLLRSYMHWDVHEVPDNNSLLELETSMNFLAGRGEQEDIRLLASTLTGLGRYQEASSWLQQVNLNTDPAFHNYFNQIISEGIAGRDVYHLSSGVVENICTDINTSPEPVQELRKSIDWVYNDNYHPLKPEEINYQAAGKSEETKTIVPQVGNVFPNPFTESITFYIPEAKNGDVTINVSDLSGRIIWNVSLKKGQTTIKWVPTDLTAGTYLSAITLSDGTVVHNKIVYLK